MKIILSALLLIISTCSGAGTITNFSGPFDVSNFTRTPNGGSIDTAGAPFMISLTSSDTGYPLYDWRLEGNQDFAEFTIKIEQSFNITFNYSFITSDVGGIMGRTYYDPFGFVLNGVFTQVTVPSPFLPDNQNGTVNLKVSAGDIFGFRAASINSSGGSATTTIYGFLASNDVPEPASIALIVVGLIAFAVARCKFARPRNDKFGW